VGCNVPFKILTVRDEYDVCGGNVFQSSITVFVIRVTSFVTIMEMKSLMVSTRAILIELFSIKKLTQERARMNKVQTACP
jgi:hypothetical protein